MICQCLADQLFRKIIDLLATDKSQYFAEPRPIIANYSLIKHFSRLFRSQITSRTNSQIYICKRCFTHHTKEELFQKHISYCSTNETVAVKMPPRNTKLKFQIIKNSFQFLL